MSRPLGFIVTPRLHRAWLALGVSGLLGMGCVEQQEEKPTPEDQEFVKKNLLSAAPTPQFAVNADLDGKVILLGADVAPNPIEAGRDVKVTQYWKVVEAPGTGWRLFDHVGGPGGAGYQNRDHGPVRSKYPVAQWKAGDIIKDEWNFSVPASWQFDNVEIRSGLWKHSGNQFVNMNVKTAGVADPRNRVLVAKVPVKGGTPAAPPKKYLVRRTLKPIKIDGKLDEAAWKTAPSVGAFVNTLTGAPSEIKTDAKLLWDDQNLYFAFENQDSDVWGTLTHRDDKLWTQEVDEVMIDADGNGKTYVELQVAPNGNIFDTYLPEWRKYEDTLDPKRKPYDWNSKLKAVVKVDGTINKRDDQDKGWTVEAALPLADANGLASPGVKVPPAPGDVWRINLFRLDAPKGKGQIAAAWSPPLTGDFHVLDRFGQLVFASENGDVPAPPPAMVHGAAGSVRQELMKEALKGAHGGMNGALRIEGRKAPSAKKSTAGDGEKPKK